MFRLSREVRFAANAVEDGQLDQRPTNSYAGYPSLTGAGQFFTLKVTLAGSLKDGTPYLLNIKQIDEEVRRRAIPLIVAQLRRGRFAGGAGTLTDVFETLRHAWPDTRLDILRLTLTPFSHVEIRATEHPMVRLSQRFEFCASHRLHNPALSDAENAKAFGKCNNPHGHGHNYELEVTLRGKPDAAGLLTHVPDLERIVSAEVIDRFDHRNLNVEVPEFRELNPSVENIAMVIYRILKPKLAAENATLAAVTVWETPKTSCEYSE